MPCTAVSRDLSLYEFAKRKFHTLPAEQIRPHPLITGADLIAAGCGPQFKKLLTAVEDAQLDGSISAKEEAMGVGSRNLPVITDQWKRDQ